MRTIFYLLQINLQLGQYKLPLLSLVTAFVITLLTIPLLIKLVRKYGLCDVPNARKSHNIPVPTMGGVAIVAGMLTSLVLWMPMNNELRQVCFFFSILVLFGMGIMDDLKDLSAKYKLAIQTGLAVLIALSGIRITSFEGLFGIGELSLASQYLYTILAIVGITNAFNLIDGIDGLAGGIGFMSLVTLGMFLVLSGDPVTALTAFALAGAMLGFLYFNFNPAKIFMGDTGSLVLGFVISVLCIRLLQVNVSMSNPVLPHAPVFILGIVLVPVADTLRVFAVRIWNGKSPFEADKTHIHHLLTNAGHSHAFAARAICAVHAFILIEVFWLRGLRQEFILLMLVVIMYTVISVFSNSHLFFGRRRTFGRRYTGIKEEA